MLLYIYRIKKSFSVFCRLFLRCFCLNTAEQSVCCRWIKNSVVQSVAHLPSLLGDDDDLSVNQESQKLVADISHDFYYFFADETQTEKRRVSICVPVPSAGHFLQSGMCSLIVGFVLFSV